MNKYMAEFIATSWLVLGGCGIAAGGILYLIASGQSGFDLAGGFASNGFGEHSPGGYTMTAMFLIVIGALIYKVMAKES